MLAGVLNLPILLFFPFPCCYVAQIPILHGLRFLLSVECHIGLSISAMPMLIAEGYRDFRMLLDDVLVSLQWSCCCCLP